MALLQDTSRVRGIRHGNPLSDFIFVTVMEFISVHMHLATESGRIQPLKRSDLDGLLEELLRNHV